MNDFDNRFAAAAIAEATRVGLTYDGLCVREKRTGRVVQVLWLDPILAYCGL